MSLVRFFLTVFKFSRAVQPTMENRLRSHVLTAKNLTIARGDMVLCSAVDFSVASGQILHIQGSNGIGKTTLMMMLAGLIPLSNVDKATIMWGDQKPEDWSVLYIGHLIGLNAGLSVRENLRFVQRLNSVSDATLDMALNAVGLSGYEDITVAKLSSGQKRRVSLARLWLTEDADQLWLLDEPFTALDAVMANRVSERLIEHTKAGGRVILTSHQSLKISVEILSLDQYSVQHDDVEWVREY